MTVEHVEVLVEEPSAAEALRLLLPNVLGDAITFEVYAHQGKSDLLARLPELLRGYAKWLPDTYRVLVVVDRDGDDCVALKARLEEMARDAGLPTRTVPDPDGHWFVVNRIAIEELEAWFFGDWNAVRAAYPKVGATIPKQAAYRDPDAIRGGTAEALERVLQEKGYFTTGLRKTEAARAIAARMQPAQNTSPSFRVLVEALSELVSAAAVAHG